jgi:hypothetical protein
MLDYDCCKPIKADEKGSRRLREHSGGTILITQGQAQQTVKAREFGRFFQPSTGGLGKKSWPLILEMEKI